MEDMFDDLMDLGGEPPKPGGMPPPPRPGSVPPPPPPPRPGGVPPRPVGVPPPPPRPGGMQPPPRPGGPVGGLPPTPVVPQPQVQKEFKPLDKNIQVSREKAVKYVSSSIFNSLDMLPTLLGVVDIVNYTQVLTVLTLGGLVVSVLCEFILKIQVKFPVYYWAILVIINGIWYTVCNNKAVAFVDDIADLPDLPDEVVEHVASPPIPPPLTPPIPTVVPPPPPLIPTPPPPPLTPTTPPPPMPTPTVASPPPEPEEDEWEVQTPKKVESSNYFGTFEDFGGFGSELAVDSESDGNLFEDPDDLEINLDDFIPKSVNLKNTKPFELDELISESNLEENFKSLEEMDSKISNMLDLLTEI